MESICDLEPFNPVHIELLISNESLLRFNNIFYAKFTRCSPLVPCILSTAFVKPTGVLKLFLTVLIQFGSMQILSFHVP